MNPFSVKIEPLSRRIAMQVSEVMHVGVRTVDVTETIRNVAKLMKEEDIGAVPVVQNERAIGLVTDRDIVIGAIAEDEDLDEPVSKLIIDSGIYSVSPSTTLDEASRIMKKNKISRLLVTEDYRPIGMLSVQDLALYSEDEELTGEVISEIKEY